MLGNKIADAEIENLPDANISSANIQYNPEINGTFFTNLKYSYFWNLNNTSATIQARIANEILNNISKQTRNLNEALAPFQGMTPQETVLSPEYNDILLRERLKTQNAINALNLYDFATSNTYISNDIFDSLPLEEQKFYKGVQQRLLNENQVLSLNQIREYTLNKFNIDTNNVLNSVQHYYNIVPQLLGSFAGSIAGSPIEASVVLGGSVLSGLAFSGVLSAFAAASGSGETLGIGLAGIAPALTKLPPKVLQYISTRTGEAVGGASIDAVFQKYLNNNRRKELGLNPYTDDEILQDLKKNMLFGLGFSIAIDGLIKSVKNGIPLFKNNLSSLAQALEEKTQFYKRQGMEGVKEEEIINKLSKSNDLFTSDADDSPIIESLTKPTDYLTKSEFEDAITELNNKINNGKDNKNLFDFKEDKNIDPDFKKEFLKNTSIKYPEHLENQYNRVKRWNYEFNASNQNGQQIAIYNAIPYVTDSPIINNLNLTMQRRLLNTIKDIKPFDAEKILYFFNENKNNHAVLYKSILELQKSPKDFINYVKDDFKTKYLDIGITSQEEKESLITKLYATPYQSLLESTQLAQENKNLFSEMINDFFDYNQTTWIKKGDTREEARLKTEKRESKEFIENSRILQQYKTDLVNKTIAEKVIIRSDNPHSLKLQSMIDNDKLNNSVLIEKPIEFKNTLDQSIKFEQARDHAIDLGMQDKTALTPYRYMQFVSKGLNRFTATQNALHADFNEIPILLTPLTEKELFKELTTPTELRKSLDALELLKRQEYQKQGIEYGEIKNYIPQAWSAEIIAQDDLENVTKIFIDNLDLDATSKAYYAKSNERMRNKIQAKQQKLIQQDNKKYLDIKRESNKVNKQYASLFGDITENPKKIFEDTILTAQLENEDIEAYNNRVLEARQAQQRIIVEPPESQRQLQSITKEERNILDNLEEEEKILKENFNLEEITQDIKDIQNTRKQLLTNIKRKSTIDRKKIIIQNQQAIEAQKNFSTPEEIQQLKDLPLKKPVKPERLQGQAFRRFETHNKILQDVKKSSFNINELQQSGKELSTIIDISKKLINNLENLNAKDLENTTITDNIKRLKETNNLFQNEYRLSYKQNEKTIKTEFKETKNTFYNITDDQKKVLFSMLKDNKDQDIDFLKDFNYLSKKIKSKKIGSSQYIDELLNLLEEVDKKKPLAKRYIKLKKEIIKDTKLYKNIFTDKLAEQKNNIFNSIDNAKSLVQIQRKDINNIVSQLTQGLNKLSTEKQQQLITRAKQQINQSISQYEKINNLINEQIRTEKSKNTLIIKDIAKEEKAILKKQKKLLKQKNELQNKLDNRVSRIVTTRPITKDAIITENEIADIIKLTIENDPLTTNDFISTDNAEVKTNATNRRIFHFKDIEAFNTVNKLYGRYPDLKELVYGGYNSSIRKIAGLKALKTSPSLFESEFDARLHAVLNGGNINKDLSFSDKLLYKSIQQQLKYINGKSYNKPLTTSQALLNTFLPSITSLGVLGGVSITSLIGDSLYSSLYASRVGQGFFKTFYNYFKSILQVLDKEKRTISPKEAKRFLVHIEDLAIDLHRTADDRCMAKSANILQKAGNKIYKLGGTLSGVNYITNRGKVVFNRMFLEGIADAETNPKMQNILKNNHGFTDKEIAILKQNVTIDEIDNLPKVNTEFKESDLYIKMLNAMYLEERKAIASASQALKAITSADTESGALQIILHNLFFLKRIPMQVFYDNVIEPLFTDKDAPYKIKTISQNITVGIIAGAFMHFFRTLALGRKPDLDNKGFWIEALKQSDVLPPFIGSLNSDRNIVNTLAGGNSPYLRYLTSLIAESGKEKEKRNYNKYTLNFLKTITPQHTNPLIAKLFDDMYFHQLQRAFNPEAYKEIEKIEKYRMSQGQGRWN